MKCCICQKSIPDVNVLYRINAKGVPGIYACEVHVKNTDAKIDDETREIVNILTGGRNG